MLIITRYYNRTNFEALTGAYPTCQGKSVNPDLKRRSRSSNQEYGYYYAPQVETFEFREKNIPLHQLPMTSGPPHPKLKQEGSPSCSFGSLASIKMMKYIAIVFVCFSLVAATIISRKK
jgi:hypothetical protein